MSTPFTPLFENLPASLPVFPLAGAVVMPRARLTLNIFEPRYLTMVFDALGAERMIGMIQPNPAAADADREAVCATGTAGRLTSFSETNDGRLLIVLTGVCRFDVRAEIPTTRGYRRVVPNWSRFRVDYLADGANTVDRTRLLRLLRAYFKRKGLAVDWAALEQLSTLELVNFLVGNLPLGVTDRQALIEAIELEERARLLMGLMDLELANTGSQSDRQH